MIYQTQSSILAELLSLDSKLCTNPNSVLDDILMSDVDAHKMRRVQNASNDRTQLKHQR
jgi:hypothetical protein